MKIQCTLKLLEALKTSPEETGTLESPFYDWHANIIQIGRKKTIFLVNDLIRMCLTLYGATAKDFKVFSQLVQSSITRLLLDEQINPETVAKYMAECGEVVYTKTQSRSMVAKMNTASKYMEYQFDELIDPSQMEQKTMNLFLNSVLQTGYQGEYVRPCEELLLQFEKHYGPECVTAEMQGLRLVGAEGVNHQIKQGSHEPNRDKQASEGYNLEESNPFDQKQLTFVNRKGEHFTFEVYRRNFPKHLGFEAQEMRGDEQPGRRVAMMRQFPCDETQLWQEFCTKVASYVDGTYLKKEKDIFGNIRPQMVADEVAGYLTYNEDNSGTLHDVVIDGVKYTWEELGRMLTAYEGHQFQLKVCDYSDDILRG